MTYSKRQLSIISQLKMAVSSCASSNSFRLSAAEWKSNILVIVIDVHDESHSISEVVSYYTNVEHSTQFSVTEYMNHITAFANAYITADQNNAVSLILAHQIGSSYVYPPSEPKQLPENHPQLLSGKQESVAIMNVALQEEVQRVTAALAESTLSEVSQSTHLSSALGKALCYIQLCRNNRPLGVDFKPRILVIKTAQESARQYSATMNCIFAAQKDNIPIDSCVLWRDSSFLQQASDITRGIYILVDESKNLLQFLLWVFLTDTETRKALCLPQSVVVDYRAACCCHTNLVETGLVCSVCLSIYCQFTPICTVCQTHFKLPTLPHPKLGKGKKKKTKSQKNNTLHPSDT